MLGIPLALERVEGPSTSLSFLGIVTDTVHMQLHLPPDKLIKIRDLISTWLSKKSARALLEVYTPIMQLLRSLWFFTAHYDIDLNCMDTYSRSSQHHS